MRLARRRTTAPRLHCCRERKLVALWLFAWCVVRAVIYLFVCVCVCVCLSLSLSLSLSASLCGCVCLCVHVCIEYSFAQCCNAVLRRFFTAVTSTELTSFPSPSLHCVCMYVCTRMCVWLSRNRVNCGVIRYGPLCPCVSWPSLLPHTPRCLQLLRPHQLRLRDLGGH